MSRRGPGAGLARRRRIPLLPVVVFVATTFVFLAPALLGQRTYAGVDLLEAGAPYRDAIERPPQVVSPLQTDQAETLAGVASFFRNLRHLHWQTWDPHVAAGTPTGILPIGGLLSPLSLGYLFLPAWYAVGLKVALGLLLAQWGTYLLLRRLRVGVAAATLGGVAYAFAGTNLVFVHRVTAPLVFPALLWAVHRLAERVDGRRIATVAALVAWCWFEGFPSAFFYCLYAAAAFAIWMVVCAARREHGSIRSVVAASGLGLLAAAAAFALGLLLSMVSLIPLVVEVLQRQALAHRATAPLPAIQQFGLLDPVALGQYPKGQFWTGLNPVESASYVGLMVAAAAAVGLFLAARGRLRLPKEGLTGWTFFSGAAVVMLLLCYRHTPILFDVVSRVPGVSHNPIARSRFILNLAVVVVAAITVDHWWRRDARREQKPNRFFVTVVIAVVAASFLLALPAWVRGAHKNSQLKEVGASVAANALLLGAAAFVGWLVARRRAASALVMVVAGLLFAQLAWPYRHFTPAAPISDFYQRQVGDRVLARLTGGRYRFAATELRNFYPNSSQLLGLYDLRGQAVHPPALKRLIEAGSPSAFRRDPLKIVMTSDEWNVGSPVWDDLAVGYFVLGTDSQPFGVAVADDRRWDKWRPADALDQRVSELTAPGPLAGASVALQGGLGCVRARIGLALEAGGRTLDVSWRPGADAGGGFLPFALTGDQLAPGQPFRLSVRSDRAACRPSVGTVGSGSHERLALRLLAPDPRLRLRLVATQQGWIYQRTGAWPLVSVHPRWRIYPTQHDAVAAVAGRPAGDETAAVVGPRLPAAPAGAGQGRIDNLHFADADVRFRVTATGPVLAVVSQNVDRFWQATLDGHRVPIRSVDGALGGVIVPAGVHQVHLRYRPIHFYAGAALSGLTAIGLVGLAVSDRPRRSSSVRL